MKTTLFVVDDDEMFQKIMRMTLLKYKSFDNIVHFRDSRSALQHLLEYKLNPGKLPEALFVDLSLPVLNGWAFLDELGKIYHSLSKKINVYIVTTSVNRFDRLKAESYDFVKEFISKPVYGDKLVAIHQSIVEDQLSSEVW
jgi:CheY-like chemotaxis protein